MIARWFTIVRPIHYKLNVAARGERRPWFDIPPDEFFAPATMFPAQGDDDGSVGESYLTMAVGRAGVELLLAAGDLVDLGTRYEAPPSGLVPWFKYQWPDRTP